MVEGVVLAVAVRGGGVGGVGLDGGRDVGVDPERPQGVVEIEDDELGEGEGGVGEGGGEEGGGGGCGVC